MMEDKLNNQEKQFLRKRKNWKRWRKVFSVLACLVVFCTTYALILPAITQEKDAYCGYEEHPGHTVEAGCYSKTKTLVCDKEESSGHKHSTSCYDTVKSLTCDQEESEGHAHDDSCYNEAGEEICGQKESKGHTHDDHCYKEEQVLICDKEETEGHTHGDSCYEVEEKLICEKEIHTHTTMCYSDKKADVEKKADWEKTFKKVKLTEHWAEDVIAIADSQLGYKESTKNYVLDDNNYKKGYTRYGAWYGDKHEYDDWAAMFVAFCLNYAKVDDRTVPVDSDINKWIGKIIKDKDLNYYRPDEYVPKVGDLIFFDWDEYKKEDDRVSDHMGLIAKLKTDDDGNVIELKVIEGDSYNKGSDNDEVRYVDYAINDGSIMGYAELPLSSKEQKELEETEAAQNDATEATTENVADETTTEATTEESVEEATTENSTEETAPEATTEEVAEETATEATTEEVAEEEDVIEKVFEGADYTVTVHFTKMSEIPENAELVVEEINPESTKYQECYRKAAEALDVDADPQAEDYINDEEGLLEPAQGIVFARFFDINFIVDGMEIEPKAPVDVIITYKDPLDLENNTQTNVVHFAEKGIEVLDVETSINTTEVKTEGTIAEEENTVDTFSFTQESFSITGTVVTGNTMPTGNVIIFMKQGNNYYAIDKDGKAIKVEYTNGTVYSDSNTYDLIWKITSTGTQNYYYIQNVANTKYLRLRGSGVNLETTRYSVKSYYNNAWRLSSTSTTAYYLNINTSNTFLTSTTEQTVYFARNIVYRDNSYTPVNPDLQKNIEAVYDHNKTIDYLGDGGTNQLTTLSGEDLYRLSLDMTGIRKPVDMLLVVDASGSMKGNGGTTKGMPEVIKFLNGTGNGTYGYDESIDSFKDSKADGFIKEFFELNDQNRLAIAAFGGYDTNNVKTANTTRYTDLSSNPDYDYTIDAWQIKTWNDIGTTYTSVPVADGYYPDANAPIKGTRPNAKSTPGLFIENSNWVQGTNYCAGLMVAEDMFKDLNQRGNGGTDRIRILVFLSDGMPTYSIIPTGDTDVGKVAHEHEGMHYLRRGQGQQRYYLANDISSATGTPGTNDTYYDSEQAFERYRQKYPEVVNYSIAFRVDSGADDVLKYIGSTDKNRTNAENFKAATNYTDIMDMILGVFRPLDVSIIDKLTSYVKFYTTQPDVKVTMTPKGGGNPIVLWEGYNQQGQGTSNNHYDYEHYVNNVLTHTDRPIVESVTYADEEITAKFDQYYTLNQDYTYAVSFNVKSSDQAYDTYASLGYNNTGDAGTDANTNTTSSNQSGLRSNDTALAKYKNTADQTNYATVGYLHPVIQVDKSDLTLIKVDQYDNPLSGATFELKKNGQSVGTYTVSEDGTVTIPCEKLITGRYSLEETEAPEGAIKSDESISFEVDRGMLSYDEPTAGDNFWTWGNPVSKATDTVNNKTTYPKNQFYHYNLKIKNNVPAKTQEILLQKIDSFGEPLDHAKFTLYQEVTDVDTKPTGFENKAFTIEGNNVNKDVVKIVENLETGRKKATIQNEEIEVDALIYSGSLEVGTYYLVEDSAPDGYNNLQEPVVIEIDSDNVVYKLEGSQILKPVKIDNNSVENSAKITNTNGYQLPESGGSGTYMFTIGGLLLCMFSLLYGSGLWKKRERRSC